jgi:hypothetical protein
MFPTPTAQDAKNNGSASQQSRNTPLLNVVAQMLPTPTADDANNVTHKSGSFQSLTRAVTQWATPTVCGNYNRKGASPSSGDGLQTQVGGKLNPEWVAWLMGWPIGWASFAPLEMDKFQSWLQQHSEC